MDMSGESKKRVLLPEGWRNFEILTCVEELSKAGNQMFKIRVADVETSNEEDIYAIAVQGKRWYLKQLLTACGVAAGQDGVYKWDIPDILGRIVRGKVEHYKDEWINRENRTVVNTKHKVATFENLDTEEEIEVKKNKTPF